MYTSPVSRRPRLSGCSDASEPQTECQRFQKNGKLHPLDTQATHLTHDSCLGLANIEGEGAPEVALNGLFRLLVRFGGWDGSSNHYKITQLM
jgi:hypothetical protein